MMCVLDEFEPNKATNLVNPHKYLKWMLNEFSNVTLEELSNELPLIRQVNHAIKVMLGVVSPTKAPYWMNH
jgi:hypothetical protein